MPFLGPWFLMAVLGAVGASIPIILHFFFRSRYKTVFWGAMDFLLASIDQTSRRLKFQELLLLILRCAMLLLLALALARPAISLVAGSSGRDAVDAVLLIDNSFSMGAREGAKSRFDLAKSAALNAINQLPPHSTVQLFTCGTAVSEPLLRDPANLDQARKVLEQLELSHQATDLGPGLALAVKTLERSRAANKELYLFSDMQKQGFVQSAGEVNMQLSHAKEFASVYLVRCGTRALATAAIIDLAPQTGIPRPGQRVGFAVVVRNTGVAPLRLVQVGLAVDGAFDGAEMQTIPELAPGATRALALTARFEKPGFRVVTAFLSSDDLPGDNYLDRVIEVRDKVKVLVVDGSPNARDPGRSSSYFLVNALAPTPLEKKGEYYLQTEVISPRQAGGELLKDKALCVLVNVRLPGDGVAVSDVPTTEFTDSLIDFVHKGGGLIIYGGDNVNIDAYNKTLGGAGLLPVQMTDTQSFAITTGTALDPLSAAMPYFSHFRNDPEYVALEGFPVLKSLGLDEPGAAIKSPRGKQKATSARVLFRYNNGKPAMVARKVGFGEVLVVGTSADPGYKAQSGDRTWNWLNPNCPFFVPLVEGMLNYMLDSQSQSHNVAVGEALRYVPTEQSALRPFNLIEPGDRANAKVSLLAEGTRVPLGPAKKVDESSLVVSPPLTRAGVYWLTTRDGDADDRKPFAVAADLRESADLQTLADAEIDRQLEFSPVHMTATEDVATVFASERTNREWTGLLLWLVLALALSESLLAWFCGRAW